MATAIISAIGMIMGAVGGMVTSANQRKTAYQEWLNAAVPQYTDVFANYKTPESKNNLVIIGSLAALIIAVIIAIVIKNSEK